ncbi:hypothetical protein [Pseudomonas aeruginosa]|uniref:hypothetical protein n=1 Tax=Pseudomonas aeruginosa TaxID=287 RepID=UPI0035A58234
MQKPKKVTKPKRLAPAGSAGSVIDAFNRAHDVEALLEAHGYLKRGKKWLCPQSSTGLPGVTVSEGGCIHTMAQTLANGHQNDAFDVFCILDHNGNQGEAVKAAARTGHRARVQGTQCSRGAGAVRPDA